VRATGSGKSRLLAALAAQGAQVLDLERLAATRLAARRASGEPQPSQKMFDSLVWSALKRLDPRARLRRGGKQENRPAAGARAAPRPHARGRVLRLEVPVPERVRFLIEEYRHFLEHPQRSGEAAMLDEPLPAAR